MVESVRSGQSVRSTAHQFKVSAATVQLWVARAQGRPLDQVDWAGRSHAPHHQPMQTARGVQERVMELRKSLADQSDLGEYGAEAIHMQLLHDQSVTCARVPSVATINRILRRHGCFDGRRRIRRAPPVSGWYLPEVASRHAEIDETDFVEALFLEGGQELCAYNLVSLHGGWCASWLLWSMQVAGVRECLLSHWRHFGLPDYVQFDNANSFTGPRQHPDTIGTVIRMCSSLGVTPVFAVPKEFGIQSAIESYNNLWQQKVWHRFHFETVEQAQRRSDRYVAAVRHKRQQRFENAPPRRLFPDGWTPPEHLIRQGEIIFLRRTDAAGHVQLLGRTYHVDADWCHRLVRCEIDLSEDCVRVYGLRRQAPDEQPILREWAYRLPDTTRSPTHRLD